jgi:hypothetical protein
MEQIDRAIDAFIKVGRELGVVKGEELRDEG